MIKIPNNKLYYGNLFHGISQQSSFFNRLSDVGFLDKRMIRHQNRFGSLEFGI